MSVSFTLTIDRKISFGERISLYRLAKGWTQRQLAEYAQVAYGRVSALERNLLPTDHHSVHRICDALGVNRDMEYAKHRITANNEHVEWWANLLYEHGRSQGGRHVPLANRVRAMSIFHRYYRWAESPLPPQELYPTLSPNTSIRNLGVKTYNIIKAAWEWRYPLADE